MPQSKPSESKTVGFFAGRVPYLCYFTNYGDYLAMHGLPVDADWETPFMFADMHCARPGETLGGYLKAVVRQTATKDYQSVAVECHEGVNAQGIRVGVCNVLARYVPASFAMCNTGHSQDGVDQSAYFKYMRADEALCSAGEQGAAAGLRRRAW